MKRMFKLFVAVAVPATFVGTAFTASAGGMGPARAHHRLVKRLVKAGALEKSDVEGLKTQGKELRACFQQIKSGQAQKGACLSKRIDMAKAQLALLQKAQGKVQEEKLQKRVSRAIEHLQKRITRMESKASGAQQPAPAPAPAPAQ